MYMTGYAASRDYVGNLQSPWRTPHLSTESTHPTEKQDPDPLVADFDPLVASPVRVFCAQNSQREGGGPVFGGMCGSVWGPPRRL